MKKRMLSTLLSLLLVMLMLPTMPAAAADSPTSWAVDAVTRANSLGLLPSNLNGSFTQNITRAEFCALAVPVYEKFNETAITQLRDFTDTTDINVRKIGCINVVSGTGNGAFNPNGEITRQEAAVILANLMSALGSPLSVSEPTFADNAQIDSWARAAVGQVQRAGIMAGTGNNNFTPKGDGGRYTREQSIVTLMRVWDLMASANPNNNENIAAETNHSDNENITAEAIPSNNENTASEANILVAYFSATGTTKTLAEYAADILSADLYEIKPEVPYTSADLNYSDNSSRSNREQNDSSSRPTITGTVTNMDKYDVVFLGYPIWWGQAPKIINTFLEQHDFSGKTIVPFCTSGSSGIGSSATNLQKLCADSTTWLSGSRFGGSTSRSDMEKWMNGLEIKEKEVDGMIDIRISFGNSVFSAKFYDTETTRALIAQFPMTLNMTDLHSNEKYYNFSSNLPGKQAEKPASMNAGDIMLWQGNCLVLFYKTFSNSYGSYDRLGYIEDVTGYAAALGGGNVDITFTAP